MKRRRVSMRWSVAIGAVGLVAAAAAAWNVPASADQGGTSAPSIRQAAAEPPVALLTRLERQLGDRTSGTYLDAAGRPVVTVTDGATAQWVQRQGAVAKQVAYSRTQLRSGMSLLNEDAAVPGTSWVVDPASNQIVVDYDSTVTAAGARRLRTAVSRLGGMVRMQAAGGVLSTRISGGSAIFGRSARCSLGFVVRTDNGDAFLTAGHCGNVVRTWFGDAGGASPIGSTVESQFPGDDFALVDATQTTVALSGTVGRRDITDARTPVVGETVTRRGSTSGSHTGQVTALDATVNFPEGSVRGMIRTTVCAEPGDSGGPLFSGSDALGITSGGNGDCTRGGVTFFQPVVEALQVFGATVV